MIRWYVWPVQEVEVGESVYRGPKYLKWRQNPGGIDVPWSWMDYGLMPTGLLVADVTQEQHDLAATRPDITTIPENIDSNPGTVAVAAVKDALEDLHIPANWVNTSYTYRAVMRRVAHFFQFAQRYSGRTARRLIEAGYNLNTVISALPVNVRVSLAETAQSLGLDTSGITGDMTVRQALGVFADQWDDVPVTFGNLAEL